MLLAAIALLLATPVAASGADFKNGDVFVGTSTGEYNVYDNGGTLLETIDQAPAGRRREAVDCAFDRSGVLYTTAFRSDQVIRFLGPAPHNKLSAVPVGDQPESVSFARDGSFYVGHQSNHALAAQVQRRRDADHQLLPDACLPALIDLSADQRTVFYTDRTAATPPVVHRFDVEDRRRPPRLRGPRRHRPHRRHQAAAAGRRQRRRDRRADRRRSSA